MLMLTCLLAANPPALAEGIKTGSTAASPAGKKRLLIVGSTTTAPMIEKMADLYVRQNPDVEIVVETGGSGRAVKDILAGQADIGMVSRFLSPEEKALFVIPLARDGVALVVHKSNPVRALSKTQARDIFTGRITHWKALGGTAQAIEVQGRVKGQGAFEILNHYLDLKPEELKVSKSILRNEDVVTGVTSTPNAVGVLSVGLTIDALEHGVPLKALILDGITPMPDSIRNGSWPMSRPLVLVTRSVPTGLAQEFIQFTLSPAVRPIILGDGFTPY
ncbi:MAG: phosphate ABC transporter substrate-binding protein [Magnetococcus sp. YQC-9]